MKFLKIVLFFLFFLFFLFQRQDVFAEKVDKKVTLYFFWGKGCTHCAKEQNFLKQLQVKYPYLEVKEFEIYENAQNRLLLEGLSKKLNFRTSSLPITIIQQRHFIGFLESESSGKRIEEAVVEEYRKGSNEIGIYSQNPFSGDILSKSTSPIPDTLWAPFFGQIHLKNLSLPLLSITLGAIDGFNPCAMWVLVMLLSFLIGIHDRRRLIFLGGLFLLASAFVYFLFLVAWLNVMLFLSYIPIIKISIGILAILGGGYYLKEFWTNREGVCKVTGAKQKRMLSEKLQHFINGKKIFFAVCAIIILAFLINTIELVCSAGLPAVYTQVLALTPLTRGEYFFQIFLYIFFFMLDDLIVFLIAIFSLELMHLTSKYSRYSHLIGGSLLLVIGSLLIFKPEWLMFG